MLPHLTPRTGTRLVGAAPPALAEHGTVDEFVLAIEQLERVRRDREALGRPLVLVGEKRGGESTESKHVDLCLDQVKTGIIITSEK